MNLAYAAGFFDGEGCVSFCRQGRTIYPRVLVVNTNREILEDLQAQFGGDIKPLCLRKPGWKQGWQWRVSWATAVRFLLAIKPWVRVKARQIDTVEAWDECRPGQGNRAGWDRDTFELLWDRMRWLNKKGPVESPDPVELAAAG